MADALNDFNTGLEEIESKIKGLVSLLSNQVQAQLTKSVSTARQLGDEFSKGKDVSKKLAKEIFDLNVKNEVISLKELKVKKDLQKALQSNNQARITNLTTQLSQIRAERSINEELDTQLRALEVQNRERAKQNNLTSVLKGQWKSIAESLKDFTSIGGLLKIAIDAALRFSKASTDIGKSLGYGADRANKVTTNITLAAQGSENLNFTLANAAEAMGQLSEATGFVAEYSADALETQIMLTKQFGLTADEAAGIYKFSILTGRSSSQVNDAMVGAFVATRNQLRVGVPFKTVMAEAAKVSGQLAANLQNNPELITKAIVQAKALGTTLEQNKSQGEFLLNFANSIEAELNAELITGKQLNLERARAAALVGDQVTLMQELNNQGMTLDKFQSMNVIAQKSFAEALGTSADVLSDQLRKQKMAIEQGKSLAQITKEEAIEAEKRQDVQARFNQAILKLQDLVGNLVAGPLGRLLDILIDISTVVEKVVVGIQNAFGSDAAKVFIGAAAGFAAGGPIGALVGASAGWLSAAMGDDIVGYGARTLITPKGNIALNNNDTVIAGTNLFKGDDTISMPKGSISLGGSDLSPMIAAINEVRAAVHDLTNRPVIINMDSKQVGTSLVQSTYKMA